MNSQLYSAASGLIVERQRLDLIANNLANASTPGHRTQRLFTMPSGSAPGVAPAGQYDVPGRGPLRETGRGLDVALDADSFLVLATGAGRRYTRGGSLRVSPDGELTDGAGNPVLDDKNKPIAGLGPAAEIAPDGRLVENGGEIARLRLVRDPRGVLVRSGDNLLTAGGRDGTLEDVEDPSVEAGWLEGSAVDALGELVRLIEAQRAFESYQKIVSLTMNEVNRRAVNDLAG